VDTQIEHTRERFANLEPVEDRGIEAEDFVQLSFVGTVGGEEYEGNTVDKYLYEMNRGLMPSEFDEGLIGLKAGDTTEVEFEIPETSSKEEFVGKTAHFDITVHEVKAKVLPELDDEFASTAGGFETLSEMRDDLMTKMSDVKRAGRERALERKAREALAERLEGDVPEAMVTSRHESMLREFVDGLQQRGMSVEQYLEATGYEFEQIGEDMKEQASMLVREELALEALFRALDMEVTDEDLETEIARFAEAAETTPEDIRARWENTRAIEVITEADHAPQGYGMGDRSGQRGDNRRGASRRRGR
jgi:trigger factor